MARGQRPIEADPELDLAPIMNMVIILIPLLLLSVVFVEVSVINVTAPKLSVGGPPAETPEQEEKPLNLTIGIGDRGFQISASGGNLPATGSCPADGPTLCLRSDRQMDVKAKFNQARQTMANPGGMREGEKILNEAIGAYNWRELYAQLIKIKRQYPKETVMNISADPDIPFAMVVRLMDVARYELEKDDYPNDEVFWQATPKSNGAEGETRTYELLFSDPVFAIVQ